MLFYYRNFTNMFHSFNQLEDLKFSSFNNKKFTNMSYMFSGNNLLQELDLSI